MAKRSVTSSSAASAASSSKTPRAFVDSARGDSARGRKLIVAEKPQVARDIAAALGIATRGGGGAKGRGRQGGEAGGGAFFGDDYVITWCIGHLVELSEPGELRPEWKRWDAGTLPILPDEFRLRAIKRTASQWRVVNDLLRSREFAAVINACDAGREGELIFRYCYELSGSRLPIERLWLSSLTHAAIERGFAELRRGEEFESLFAAARCRAIADWLVGMNATRAVTLWRREGQLFSLGRVQTPTLALLVRRELELQRFTPRDYFEVHAALRPTGPGATPAPPFTATYAHDGKKRLAARPLAESLRERDAAAPSPVVEKVQERTVSEPPPLLFDLGALQRTSNRRFGWTAQHTLAVAQSLYERHKLITYPRTDSRHLSHDLFATLPRIFTALAAAAEYRPFVEPLRESPPTRPPRRVFADHKVTDHHAIIPTAAVTAERLAALSADERKLFDQVARRFLSAFYPDAEFAETQLVIRVDAAAGPARAPDGDAAPVPEGMLGELPAPPDRYSARGRVRLRAGWQTVAELDEERAVGRKGGSGSEAAEAEDAEPVQALPKLAVGERLRAEFRVEAKKTRPPPRYSDASLLSAMEGAAAAVEEAELRRALKERGLGTPATRAAVIETLFDRGYIERQGKQLVPTALGCDLIEKLPVPSLTEPALTGEWEARLERLSRGAESSPQFLADITTYVRTLVSTIFASAAPAAVAVAAAPKRGRAAAARVPRHKAARSVGGAVTPAKKRSVRSRSAVEKEPATAAAPVAGRAPRRTKKSAAPVKTTSRPRKTRAAALPAARPVPAANPAPAPTGARPPGTPIEPAIRCPRCQSGRLIYGRSNFGCSNFRACPLVVPFAISGRLVDETALRTLLERGSVMLLGQKISAPLRLRFDVSGGPSGFVTTY